MPMSASVMINRSEFLDLLERLEGAIDQTLSAASEVVGDREAVRGRGRSPRPRRSSRVGRARARASWSPTPTSTDSLRHRAEEIQSEAAEGGRRSCGWRPTSTSRPSSPTSSSPSNEHSSWSGAAAAAALPVDIRTRLRDDSATSTTSYAARPPPTAEPDRVGVLAAPARCPDRLRVGFCRPQTGK